MQFDVPGWLASVLGVDRSELVFESEREVNDTLRLTYARNGATVAVVSLMAMPLADARRAAWQIAAQIGDHMEQVQLPAQTRFVWR